MTQMKAIPGGGLKPKTFTHHTADLKDSEILDLLRLLNQVRFYNNAVPINTASWIGKNQGELSDAKEKRDFEQKVIQDEQKPYLNSIEKHTNSKNIYWDGVEGDAGLFAYGNPKKDPNGQMFIEWINIANDKVIAPELGATLKPYIKDPERRKECEEKFEEFNKRFEEFREKTHKVKLTKISSDWLDETRFNVPTVMQTESGPYPLNITLFMKYLVDTKGQAEQNGKN